MADPMFTHRLRMFGKHLRFIRFAVLKDLRRDRFMFLLQPQTLKNIRTSVVSNPPRKK